MECKVLLKITYQISPIISTPSVYQVCTVARGRKYYTVMHNFSIHTLCEKVLFLKPSFVSQGHMWSVNKLMCLLTLH